MNIINKEIRPDTFMPGDHVYDPRSGKWEIIKDAYWSDTQQRYVVYCDPNGDTLHTYERGMKINVQRYY